MSSYSVRNLGCSNRPRARARARPPLRRLAFSFAIMAFSASTLALRPSSRRLARSFL